MDVPEFDVMPVAAAAQLLTSCCGARAWVNGMLARRPCGAMDRLLDAADDVWRALSPSEWREAFDHHPRIGERTSATRQDDRAKAWSSREQSGVEAAGAPVREMLRVANKQYEARFGYICIICAEGRSAEEMLSITRARLANDPDAEIRVAAEEQRLITGLRLTRLFHDPSGALR